MQIRSYVFLCNYGNKDNPQYVSFFTDESPVLCTIRSSNTFSLQYEKDGRKVINEINLSHINGLDLKNQKLIIKKISSDYMAICFPVTNRNKQATKILFYPMDCNNSECRNIKQVTVDNLMHKTQISAKNDCLFVFYDKGGDDENAAKVELFMPYYDSVHKMHMIRCDYINTSRHYSCFEYFLGSDSPFLFGFINTRENTLQIESMSDKQSFPKNLFFNFSLDFGGDEVCAYRFLNSNMILLLVKGESNDLNINVIGQYVTSNKNPFQVFIKTKLNIDIKISYDTQFIFTKPYNNTTNLLIFSDKKLYSTQLEIDYSNKKVYIIEDIDICSSTDADIIYDKINQIISDAEIGKQNKKINKRAVDENRSNICQVDLDDNKKESEQSAKIINDATIKNKDLVSRPLVSTTRLKRTLHNHFFTDEENNKEGDRSETYKQSSDYYTLSKEGSKHRSRAPKSIDEEKSRDDFIAKRKSAVYPLSKEGSKHRSQALKSIDEEKSRDDFIAKRKSAVYPDFRDKIGVPYGNLTLSSNDTLSVNGVQNNGVSFIMIAAMVICPILMIVLVLCIIKKYSICYKKRNNNINISAISNNEEAVCLENFNYEHHSSDQFNHHHDYREFSFDNEECFSEHLIINQDMQDQSNVGNHNNRLDDIKPMFVIENTIKK